MSRFLEGYDVPNDAMYNAWKSLYQEWQTVQDEIQSESYASTAGDSLSESIKPILSSILKYPSVERKPKNTRKKIDLPQHMTCEKALEILELEEVDKRKK